MVGKGVCRRGDLWWAREYVGKVIYGGQGSM
jgi:hypothetical protein